MSKQTVLITGCSSGFGKLAAKKFQQEGWNVVATMRSPEKETELTESENMLVTRLDVTDQASVTAAVDQTIERFGAINVLVNNAGYGGRALFEQFSEERIYAMYETNVFGVMRVSRAVLPIMRQQKGGTIINVTSMAGIFGLPENFRSPRRRGGADASAGWTRGGSTGCGRSDLCECDHRNRYASSSWGRCADDHGHEEFDAAAATLGSDRRADYAAIGLTQKINTTRLGGFSGLASAILV